MHKAQSACTRHKMHKAQNADLTQMVVEIDDESLKEELETCRHFLVDSEMESRRHWVFNFVMGVLDEHSLSQKLDTVFKKLNCEAKLKAAFGFAFKNIEYGTCRYYYVHENNTLMERSKFVATKEDLVEIKNVLGNNGVIVVCHKVRANTKWKFYNFPAFTVFAALLREVPMGCNDAVLQEPLSKNHTVNCLSYEENTKKLLNDNLCLFRALVLHSHRNGGLEEETTLNWTDSSLKNWRKLIKQVFKVFVWMIFHL